MDGPLSTKPQGEGTLTCKFLWLYSVQMGDLNDGSSVSLASPYVKFQGEIPS
jgi:hypothetical protein